MKINVFRFAQSAVLQILVAALIGFFVGAALQSIHKLTFLRNTLNKVVVLSLELSNSIRRRDLVEGESEIIDSHYYKFAKERYLTSSTARYGGIDKINDQILFVDGDGRAFLLKSDGFSEISNLGIRNNKDEFARKYKNSDAFGIKDILVVPTHNRKNELYVSTVEFDLQRECYYLSVWQSEYVEVSSDFKALKWTKIYSTKPCLFHHKNANYAGTSAGGRLDYDGKNHIYFSTGDFYFDGVNERDVVGEKGSDYGKIVQISIKKPNSAVPLATGFRNPQGLVFTASGLFETEHGPKGGDELNHIPDGTFNRNYGWPHATFGVDYSGKDWPLDPLNKNHFSKNFTPPLFAWLPSIGVSNLIEVRSSPELMRWAGNILVSSLRDQALHRVILTPMGRVAGMERIAVGFRIRDLFQLDNSMYLLEDSDRPVIWKLTPF